MKFVSEILFSISLLIISTRLINISFFSPFFKFSSRFFVWSNIWSLELWDLSSAFNKYRVFNASSLSLLWIFFVSSLIKPIFSFVLIDSEKLFAFFSLSSLSLSTGSCSSSSLLSFLLFNPEDFLLNRSVLISLGIFFWKYLPLYRILRFH